MSIILPKQKHTFKVGTKTVSLYPVYRGNGIWRIRLNLQDQNKGRWMPYEAPCKGSIRAIELKDCFKTLERYIRAAKEHRYNMEQFCLEAGFDFDPIGDNSKAWGCYDAIMSTLNYLENNRITTQLLTYFSEQSK